MGSWSATFWVYEILLLMVELLKNVFWIFCVTLNLTSTMCLVLAVMVPVLRRAAGKEWLLNSSALIRILYPSTVQGRRQ